MPSLTGLDILPASTITALLDRAVTHRPVAMNAVPGTNATSLAGRLIANLFFEDSTRTRGSFSVAARRLGAHTVDLTGFGSSVSKGETIVDTALNIEAMGVDALVIRSSAAGAALLVDRAVSVPVINAGDGRHEHPTQALLDLLTLRERLGSIEGRRIAIVGDIAASRVARSNIIGLVKLGAHVILVGPPTLVPAGLTTIAAGPGTVAIEHRLDDILTNVDAIMMLRVQFERGSDITSDYRTRYALTASRAARLVPGAPVLHPGPMNRGIEIDGSIADDPERSVILRQVTNGVATRMAVLEWAMASA